MFSMLSPVSSVHYTTVYVYLLEELGADQEYNIKMYLK